MGSSVRSLMGDGLAPLGAWAAEVDAAAGSWQSGRCAASSTPVRRGPSVATCTSTDVGYVDHPAFEQAA